MAIQITTFTVYLPQWVLKESKLKDSYEKIRINECIVNGALRKKRPFWYRVKVICLWLDELGIEGKIKIVL